MLNKRTEHEAEIWAERAMDKLDKRYMAGELTQEEYDEEMASIDEEVRVMIGFNR